MISFRPTIKGDKDATVIFLDKDQIKRPALLKPEIKSLLQKKHFAADAGTLFPVSTPKGVFLLVGLGVRKNLTGTQLRIIARSAFLSKFIETAKTVEVVPSDMKEEDLVALIEGIAIGTYKWRKYIQKKK